MQKRASLNKIFQVGENGENRSNLLLCEWGEHHCCIAEYDEEHKTLHNLEYFSFDHWNVSMGEVIAALEQRKKEHLKPVFCAAFPQAAFSPSKLYNVENNLLVSLYGNVFSYELHNVINEWQIVNVYAFPAPVYKRIVAVFPSALFFHVHTPELKLYNGFVAENQISVHFTPKQFRVLVKHSGQLQLAQVYHYNAPLDVVYYLLKIFGELKLDKEDAYLILSGLIDENSALYKEIESYFFNVHFALPSAVQLDSEDHPQHFFSSMYNLALCAS